MNRGAWQVAWGCQRVGHAQTHVHRIGDAIQPSHPLLSPSPPAFNLSQHQGLFQRVSSFHQVVKLLELLVYHSAFCDYSGFISFRIDWFDPLAVQRTLESPVDCKVIKPVNPKGNKP